VQNCQGWSPFSDELFVIAAEVPKQPVAASLISTDATTVRLKLFPSEDNMGAVVTDYQLYRNQGNNDYTWTKVDGYVFSSNGYIASVDVATESLTPGKYYSFTYKASNLIGDSALAPVLSVPVADQPAKPQAVTLVAHERT
jgi:hypothetical protein